MRDMYLVFVPISGTELLKLLELVFCCGTEENFGKLLRMGLVTRGTNRVTDQLELSVQTPDLQGWDRGYRLSPVTNSQ